MEVILYREEYENVDAIDSFLRFYNNLKMKYLASDLLERGLSPKQISDAIEAAVKIANSSGIEAYKHFMPVFSGIDKDIIQDCKLSHLGYGLVLMNADTNLSVVSEFQVDVLKKYLDISL